MNLSIGREAMLNRLREITRSGIAHCDGYDKTFPQSALKFREVGNEHTPKRALLAACSAHCARAAVLRLASETCGPK